MRAYETNKAAVLPEGDPVRRKVVELNARAMGHLWKGAELERSGELADAAEEQEPALRIDPALAQARVNLISLYEEG